MEMLALSYYSVLLKLAVRLTTLSTILNNFFPACVQHKDPLEIYWKYSAQRQ